METMMGVQAWDQVCTYTPGDVVYSAGCFWTAIQETCGEQPDCMSRSWILSAHPMQASGVSYVTNGVEVRL